MTKEQKKIERQIPKWVINRRYRRGPFIFLLLGVLPLGVGVLFAILYISAPEVKQASAQNAKLDLEKSSFRDKSSLLLLQMDTLNLKAEFSKAEEDRYLALVTFSKSFGQDEFEPLSSNNKSLEEQREKLIRFKKLMITEDKVKIDKISLSYLPNNYVQELTINGKTILEKRNQILFFLLWIILPILIGSYIIRLSLNFYNKYQTLP